MKLVQELLQLCIEKNETTKHDVFFIFSGLIKTITVHYSKNGSMAIEDQFYILIECRITEHKKLQQAINELQELV